MAKIDYFDLISGREIPYEGICSLKPPKLSDISEIGYMAYNSLLVILTMDLDKYLEISNLREVYNKFSEKEKDIYDIFMIMVEPPDTRELLHRALCFFISEKLIFDKSECKFLVVNDKGSTIGTIDSSNYEVIKSGILQLNYLAVDEAIPKKNFKNKRKRDIYEKIRKGKRTANKTKRTDENMNLPNLISSISACHNSYNLSNIWSLTVYQLYDQFYRLNNKITLDVIGTRWAAWGKEDFDFSVWYKDLNSKK